ncbi:MAG: BlaI/MecI/CopY family transcriptional regulator [Lachnospiraceae bacterium]|nr:BlaI/MecI/CopY family transcriptional regulator [Lachnospiraceae bacterium]
MEHKMTISDSELEILEVLWAADKALNAGEIRGILSEHKNWERTTILTLIQRLQKKGAITQEKREVYYYAPCIKREEYVRAETINFIEKFFKGNSKNLAASLVDSDALTKKDIEELRDYFNQNL